MLHLVIANKLYSSWSLRPWLLMHALGIGFEETVIPMYQPDTKARMLSFGPTGKVPVLIDGDVTVWESLAIVEYLAETYPDKSVWPRDRQARAHARAISAEMHAGFQALRGACPMNLRARFAVPALTDAIKADVARIEALWRQTRQRFGAGGAFLYGDFSAADAMYAPVVTRLDSYSMPVAADTRAYMDSILAHPSFVAWRTAAFAEPWRIDHYEDGQRVSEAYLPL
jgi:glutathione S-transferase